MQMIGWNQGLTNYSVYKQNS